PLASRGTPWQRPGREYPALPGARDVPQSSSGSPLRDPLRVPRVHVPVPEDGTARLRDDPDPLRAGADLRGAQELETLLVVVPRPRSIPRGRDQPDPRRPRRRDAAALDDRGRGLLCPRRAPHRGRSLVSAARFLTVFEPSGAGTGCFEDRALNVQPALLLSGSSSDLARRLQRQEPSTHVVRQDRPPCAQRLSRLRESVLVRVLG